MAASSRARCQADIKLWPFKVESGQGGKPLIVATGEDQGKEFHPEEISALILVEVKETAKAYVGGKANGVVVTVPAYFIGSQRQATENAGTVYGLKVMRTLAGSKQLQSPTGWMRRTAESAMS